MPNPFQVSIARLMVSVAMVGIALALQQLPYRIATGDHVTEAIWIVSGAAWGMSVGLLFRRPWLGAVMGVILAVPIVAFIAWTSQFAAFGPD